MSDYENLKKQGYTEEQINLALDQLSNIKLESAPLAQNREDKSVIVKDSQGTEKKTSSIMMGYNKKGIILSDGQYVNEVEFEKALIDNLRSDEQDVVYVCKKSGKKVESAQILQNILKEVINKSSSLKLSPDSSIKNQKSAKVTIIDNKKQKEYNKGVFMLGNNEIQLPNGQYVSAEEISLALNEYIKLSPLKQKETIDPNIPEVYRVINRIVSRFSYIPLLISTIIMILSGLGFKQEKITELVQQQDNLKYSTTKMQQMSDGEIKESMHNKITKLKTGESIEIPDGVNYFSSSDHEKLKNSKRGTFGSTIRPEGTYNLDFISILYNNNIVHIDYNKDVSIDDSLSQVAQKLGVSKEDLKIQLHIGGPVAGWVDVDDIINNYTSNSQNQAKVNLKETEKQNGVIENFAGRIITINDNVTLKVVDENGKLLPSGSIVVGNDGQKYRLDNLKIEKEMVMSSVEVGAKNKLHWSIHNITKEELLLAASVAIIGTYFTTKQKKEMTDMTESQIDSIVSEAQKKFDDQSEFKKAVTNITKKNPVSYVNSEEQLKQSLIDQEITVEDITEMKNSGGLKF